MSAFEVCVTPTRKKTVKQAGKSSSESREPTFVSFGPFSGKCTVIFENVPVTKTARRILLVQNPTDAEIKVLVTRGFRPEYNVALEWTSQLVPSNGQVSMEISWTPLAEFACKETLQLTDSRNFRKDITVIFKSIKSPTRSKTNKAHSSGISNGRPTLTLKMKSPTGMRNLNINRKSLKKVDKIEEDRARKTIYNKKPSPLGNKNDEFLFNISPDLNIKSLKKGKENVSPISPCNASTLFDKIQFTPVASKKINELEYLASLPTPGSRVRCENKPLGNCNQTSCPIVTVTGVEYAGGVVKRERGIQELGNTPRYKRDKATVKGKTYAEYGFGSVNNPINAKKLDLEEIDGEPVINKTFDLNGTKTDSVFDISHEKSAVVQCQFEQEIVNRTTIISTNVTRPLSIIEEEGASCNASNMERTFNLPPKSTNPERREILQSDVCSATLRKFSESMKDLSGKSSQTRRSLITNQGSMPNLSDMENLNSFAENRYYNNPSLFVPSDNAEDFNMLGESMLSITSATNVVFNQSEILAASSRFNINDLGASSVKRSPIYLKSRCKSSSLSPRSPITPPLNLKPKRISLTPTEHRKAHSIPSLTPTGNHKRLRASVGDLPNIEVDTLSVHQPSCLIISPPKRTKYDCESNNEISSTDFYGNGTNLSFQHNQWSKTQAKKQYFQRTLKLTKRCATYGNAIKQETRDILYDSEKFLQNYINPDPFAATTTCDPFMTGTIYMNEKSVIKHEIQIKKWLNALVAIPAEFDSDYNQKIDVGQLFNTVRNKALTLPLTKEEQSMNYLTTSRMDALRTAGIKLYQSPELTEPCRKVAAYISKQSLSIRKDRDLHLNVVLQRQILELLLNFNPLWLRIGLEVVFGQKIPMQSNADIVGLSSFILHRLFRDKYLEQKYSRAYALSEEYSEIIKKFTLQKILFLFLFLDKAKEKRIIKHNPCLFVKNSPYKETKEILLRFSAELLASVGDITRILRRLGYCLTHKQLFLDEFNYAFNNLAIDLRDGVRLTRIMEIILIRDDLTKLLRVPAISRLQRIYNVNLGLTALADANFELSGNITAADIVDGHREKTLSLLWQIIYKFRAPKFNSAAEIIQNWWKNSWLKIVIRRRISQKKEMKRNNAALLIQSVFRGYMARKYAKQFREERENAAICLQKYFRGYLAQKRFNYTRQCISVIQSWYRASKHAKEQRDKYLRLRNSTIKVQTWYRRVVLARKLEKAATVICELQTYARIQYKSAVIIQKSIKSYVIRKRFLSLIQCVVELNTQKKLENAIKIQRFYRSVLETRNIRHEFLQMKSLVIKVQRRFRANQEMHRQLVIFKQKKTAAITLQRYYRLRLQMKKQRLQYLNLRNSVIKIQRKHRATLLARKIQREFTALRWYVVLIQQRFRANCLMRIEREEYLELKKSSIIIQRRFRANQQMQAERMKYLLFKQSALIIQRRFKAYKEMRITRAKYQGTKQAAIYIQIRFREYLLMKRERNIFIVKRNAVIRLQRRFRAQKAMLIARKEYVQIKCATVVIQSRFRAYCAMKEQRSRYQKLRQAITKIQAWYRAVKSRDIHRAQYLELRQATVLLQTRFRAQMSMKRIRDNYKKLMHSTIIIQQHFRANHCMRVQRTQFLKMKSAAILIQNKWKATMLRNQQRSQFLQIRNSVCIIQNHFKAYCEMKNVKREYTNYRKHVIHIQQRYRAKIMMKTQRAEYLTMKKAAIIIQRRYRAMLLMKEQRVKFLELKYYTITIQRRLRTNWQMYETRNQYMRTRELIIFVQRLYKAKLAMRKERSDFLKLKSAAIRIQQKYRARISARIEQEKFLNVKRAVKGIQMYARGFLARKRFNEMMTPEMREQIKRRKATITIQRYWRGHLTRKARENYKMKIIRSKIQDLKRNAKPQNAVRHQCKKLSASIKFLDRRFNVQEALTILTRLENISRTLPNLLMEYSEHVSSFCYGMMAQAIRSEIDKQLIELCSRIILNMARYNCETAHIFYENYMMTIAKILLRWCDKDSNIFNTLCTLIWIFSHYPDKKRKIRTFMTTPEALYMLHQTKKLVLRRENMKKNVGKSNLPSTPHKQISYPPSAFPNFEPDFGVVRNKPYIFINSVFAFDTVLDVLNIELSY